jgi:hypothetical protein
MMDGNKIIRLTIAEAVAEAKKAPPRGSTASRERKTRWSGESFEAACKMAVEGDHASARDLSLRVGAMASIRTAKRAVQRWDVSGSSVDVGRFMAMEPECMIETVRARKPTPVLKLGIERAVFSTTSQETIRQTGASVLAAVEALRVAGVPVELWVTCSQSGDSFATVSVQVLVQKAGRPVDKDVVAFWTVNPAAFRRIAFAVEEQMSDEERTRFHIYSGGGYGHPTTPPNKDEFDEVAPAQEYQVERWLTDVLSRRAGITLVQK